MIHFKEVFMIVLIVLFILIMTISTFKDIQKISKMNDRISYKQCCQIAEQVCSILCSLWILIFYCGYTIKISNVLLGLYLIIFGFSTSVSSKERVNLESIFWIQNIVLAIAGVVLIIIGLIIIFVRFIRFFD